MKDFSTFEHNEEKTSYTTSSYMKLSDFIHTFDISSWNNIVKMF